MCGCIGGGFLLLFLISAGITYPWFGVIVLAGILFSLLSSENDPKNDPYAVKPSSNAARRKKKPNPLLSWSDLFASCALFSLFIPHHEHTQNVNVSVYAPHASAANTEPPAQSDTDSSAPETGGEFDMDADTSGDTDVSDPFSGFDDTDGGNSGGSDGGDSGSFFDFGGWGDGGDGEGW